MDGTKLPKLQATREFAADPARSYTLPAHLYYDPAIFDAERETIFYRTWQYVAHMADLAEPGSYVTTRIVDQGVFVIRTGEGALKAFYNVCRHRAHELLAGHGKVRSIACPYHAWVYDLDGQLRTARGSAEVEDFDRGEFCLNEVRLEVFGGFVFVNLDPEAVPLAEQAADLLAELGEYAPWAAELVHGAHIDFDIKANWKNVVDNFLECYHCPVSHPAFCDVVDVPKYRSITGNIHSTHMSPVRVGGKESLVPVNPGDEVQCGRFIYLWPNTTIVMFPGARNISVLHIKPDGPERTLESMNFYFTASPPTEAEMAQVKYIEDVLNPEDIEICESVQRGLHSLGYNQGRFVVDRNRTDISEHALHHFQNLVRQALGEDSGV